MRRWLHFLRMCVLIAPLMGVPMPSGVHSAMQGLLPDLAAPGPFVVGVTRRTFSRASSTTGQPRVLPTVIWYPGATSSEPQAWNAQLQGVLDAEPDRSLAPYPTIVFSHGFGGAPGGYSFLLAHLASHGFVVVAPLHPGALTPPDCPAPCTDQGWNPDSLTNRPADLAFELEVVSGLSEADDALLAGVVDSGRAGLAGHSFGGWTALRELAQEPRFRAAVVLAPGQPGLELRQSVSQTSAPIMLMAGRMDAVVPFTSNDPRILLPGNPPGTPPTAPLENAIPDLLTAPSRWLVLLPGGGHYSFTGGCPAEHAAIGRCPETLPLEEAHARIRRWATAFLLRYVAGDQRYTPLLDPAAAAGDPDVQITIGATP